MYIVRKKYNLFVEMVKAEHGRDRGHPYLKMI
jgi:hypothetical protein